jgi:hypothetical protein
MCPLLSIVHYWFPTLYPVKLNKMNVRFGFLSIKKKPRKKYYQLISASLSITYYITFNYVYSENVNFPGRIQNCLFSKYLQAMTFCPSDISPKILFPTRCHAIYARQFLPTNHFNFVLMIQMEFELTTTL